MKLFQPSKRKKDEGKERSMVGDGRRKRLDSGVAVAVCTQSYGGLRIECWDVETSVAGTKVRARRTNEKGCLAATIESV